MWLLKSWDIETLQQQLITYIQAAKLPPDLENIGLEKLDRLPDGDRGCYDNVFPKNKFTHQRPERFSETFQVWYTDGYIIDS